MPQIFPPSSDTVLRIGLLGLVGVGAAIVITPMVWIRTPYNQNRGYPVEQPVQFDHRHHYGDDEIDCLYCHTTATRGPYAGVPASSVCMGCHGQIWNNSAMLEPVRRSFFSGMPLPWNRVHRVPDFVYFDHSAHVTKGVGCVSCHGRVDLMALVHQEMPLNMGWCLDCHRNPARHLRPLDQLTSMTWRPPEDPREADGLARRLQQERRVQSLTSCTTCHR